MDTPKQYDVFISHKTTEDGEIARRLVASLEARGLKCWIAPRDIPASQNYASAIVDGINQSSVFLLLFSRYANQSDDIARELQQASRFKMPILTVRLDDSEFSPALSYFLALPQGVGPFARNENIFEGVFEHLQAILAGAATPAPKTGSPGAKKRRVPAIAAALVLLGLLAAGFWMAWSRPKAFPSTRAEQQTVNEVIRTVANLTATYQGAAEAQLAFIDEALNSLDDPSVAASGSLLIRKQLTDALELLANARPSETSIARLSDTPLDAALYRALFDGSKQEFENALKSLPVTIPDFTRRDNLMSQKDRKICLQLEMKMVKIMAHFFALEVIELLLPISPDALAEFRKHVTAYTAIPRLSQPWPADKAQLDIEQEAVMQQFEDLVRQRSTILGNQNMGYSAMRKDVENRILASGVSPAQAAEIIGAIETDAAQKTAQKWIAPPSDE